MKASILESRGFATKKYIKKGSSYEVLPYDTRYTKFNYYSYEINDFDSMVKLLDGMLDLTNCFLIRGVPREGVDITKPVYRRYKDDNPDKVPHFRDELCNWMMVDFDKQDIDPTLSLEEQIESLVAKLGPEFNASYRWQLSASYGFMEPDKMSCHVFFWQQNPLTNKQLQEWAKTIPEVDAAVYRCVQPNYTANPIFIDMDDPVQQRTGVVRKDVDYINMTPVVEEVPVYTEGKHYVSEPFQTKLDKIGGPEGFYTTIHGAMTSYFIRNGVDAPEAELCSMIRDAAMGRLRSRKDMEYIQAPLMPRMIKEARQTASMWLLNHPKKDKCILIKNAIKAKKRLKNELRKNKNGKIG